MEHFKEPDEHKEKNEEQGLPTQSTSHTKRKTPLIDMERVEEVKKQDEDEDQKLHQHQEEVHEQKESQEVDVNADEHIQSLHVECIGSSEQASHEAEHTPKSIPCLQIIDQDGVFADEEQHDRMTFDEFIEKDTRFNTLGFNYNMLSILGPQNSGKSTLLNYLFDTKFEVLDERRGRQRTTRGVWLGVVGEREDIMVMDLEGSDGSVREDDCSFERKISLFSLSVCSVLMVNIWSHDVGRYGASNMSLLKNIFELNLQLFQKEDSPKTLILFVVRDRDQRKPFENTKSVLLEDIMKIWDTVARPECFKRAPIGKFFDLEFTSLPHFKHDKEQFIHEAAELRKRFDARNPQTYFKPIYNKEIPADGLSLFTKQVWNAIKVNKDLDLPSQKEMLARYRCDELIVKILDDFEAEISAVKYCHAEKKMFEGFKKFCDDVFDEKMKQFMSVASKYLARVVKEKADVLSEKMLNEIDYMFQTQMNLAITHIKTMLSTSYFSLKQQYVSEQVNEFNPVVYEGYAQQIDDINATIKEEWKKISDESVPSNIENGFEVEINTLDRFINKLYEIGRKDLIEAMMTHFKKHLQQIMKPLLLPIFEEADKTMWEKVRAVVQETTQENLQKLESGMINSLKMEKKDVETKLNELQVYIIDAVRSTILERPSFVTNLMESKFIAAFRNDKDGLPIKWKPNDDLSKPFFRAKELAEKILDLFSYIRLDANDDKLSFISINPATGKKMIVEEPDTGIIEQTKVLFSFTERINIYESFNNMAEAAFMRAQQELAAVTVHSKTPLWLILLISFLAFDNIVDLFRSPILLAIVATIIGVIYAMTRMGYAYMIDSILSKILSVSWSSVIYLIQDLGLFKNLLPKPEAPTRKRPQKKAKEDGAKKEEPRDVKPNLMGSMTVEGIDSLDSFDAAFKMADESTALPQRRSLLNDSTNTRTMSASPRNAALGKSQSMFIHREKTPVKQESAEY